MIDILSQYEPGFCVRYDEDEQTLTLFREAAVRRFAVVPEEKGEYYARRFNPDTFEPLPDRYFKEIPAEAPCAPRRLQAADVEWVTNDLSELGVKIGDQFFFLYKGHSLVYECLNSAAPMRWRPVAKREFGECCHPVIPVDPKTVEWQPLPPGLPDLKTVEWRKVEPV